MWGVGAQRWKVGDTLRLTLDLGEGCLTASRNDDQLGALVDKLGGDYEYHWLVELWTRGDHVAICAQ